MRLTWLLLVAWLTAAPTPFACSIVIRHDRAGAAYLERAKDYDFVCQVGSGHGTLMGSGWALTAAHVAESLDPFFDTVKFRSSEYRIRRVILHPTWRGDLAPGLAELDWIDLALIELEETVTGIEPAQLFGAHTEMGRVATFVGSGRTGNGHTGATASDGQWRAATNRIERVDEGWLYFTFDSPPNGTELEGVSGPGDSGGPALIEADGHHMIAGVSSRNDDHGLGQCRYGTTEVYARVSTQIDWILSVTRDEDVGGPWRLTESGWPSSPAARLAQSFWKVLAEGTDSALVEFEQSHRLPELLEPLGAESRAQQWIDQRSHWGELTPLWVASPGPHRFSVLTESSSGVWRSFRFSTRGEDPVQLRALRVSRGTPVPSLIPDSLKQIQAELEIAREKGVTREQLVSLGNRAFKIIERSGSRGEVLSALRIVAELCRSGPPMSARTLRRRALEVAARQGEGSLRARTMLTTAFVPPLERVPVDLQGAEVAAYEADLEMLTTDGAQPWLSADVTYAKIRLRVEIDRWRAVPWQGTAERRRVRAELERLDREVGDLEAPTGGTYTEAIASLRDQLEALPFGSTLPSGGRPTAGGEPLDLESLRGRVLVLTHWTSWCVPCMKAIPHERAMVEALADEPFTFVGVSSDPSPEQAQATAQARGMPWINVWDAEAPNRPSLVSLFRVDGWPSVFVLDAEGRVRFKFQSNLIRSHFDTTDVERAVRQLLAEMK